MSRLGVMEPSVGSGLNAGRNMNKATRAQFENDYYEPAEAVLNETPEMVISENVRVTGLITFKRLFRVDGTVEGKLDAPKDAALIVGVNGKIVGDVLGLHTVFVEGCIQGNIDVQSLSLRSTAVVEGNIRSRFLEIQPKAVVRGNLVVDPAEGAVAPEEVAKKPKEPPKKNTLFLIDPQVDKHTTGATPVPGADEDSERIAAFILSDIKYIDNIVITLESRHRMHITHAVFWADEYGGHPRPFTTISHNDVKTGKWKPVNPDNLEHCLSYTAALEEEGVHRLTIQSEHCLIGTSGHSVIPLINSAVQKWAELKGKRVNYVMKGSNCLTEMYSALSAAVPLESDPATYADNELIESLFAVDRVMVCGQSLSHSVNYTVRDMLRLFSLYQEEFLSKDDPKAQIPVGNKIFLMKDGCSSHRGFENQSSEFNSFIKNAGVTSLKIQDLQAELSMNDEE